MRTHAQNREKMEQMGFHGIRDEDFFTSAMASAAYAKRYLKGDKAYYIGQEGMREALIEQGFMIDEKQADHVFIGLDVHADYEKYCKAFTLIQNGATLIGTNAAVSYTHLIGQFLFGYFLISITQITEQELSDNRDDSIACQYPSTFYNTVASVSYTHLDVYKRQALLM